MIVYTVLFWKRSLKNVLHWPDDNGKHMNRYGQSDTNTETDTDTNSTDTDTDTDTFLENCERFKCCVLYYSTWVKHSIYEVESLKLIKCESYKISD